MKAFLVLILLATLGAGWSSPADGRDADEMATFQGRVERIDPELRGRMSGVSWHRGCPVGFAGLRLLRVSHWGFDGEVYRGRLVVNRDQAAAMLTVMRKLFEQGYPIRQMRLVDAYGADDHRSMAADNTSAFNCRTVAGSRTLVQTLFEHDLIDELRLMVFPVTVGSGARLFPDSPDKTVLELAETKAFATGVQVNTYRRPQGDGESS